MCLTVLYLLHKQTVRLFYVTYTNVQPIFFVLVARISLANIFISYLYFNGSQSQIVATDDIKTFQLLEKVLVTMKLLTLLYVLGFISVNILLIIII